MYFEGLYIRNDLKLKHHYDFIKKVYKFIVVFYITNEYQNCYSDQGKINTNVRLISIYSNIDLFFSPQFSLFFLKYFE